MKFVLLTFLLSLSFNFSSVVGDTCDTYRHPTYGLGQCVDTSLCPNALYVSGLCESKPSNVKCCFSVSSSSVTCSSGQKLTHTNAYNYIKAVGIGLVSSGGCTDRNNPRCTSLEQVNCKTISEIVNYKKVSTCAVTVTGGTETGHSSGTQSHWNGYKLDISIGTCNDNYIKTKFTYIGKRGDGADMWKDSRGNIFAREGDHWDILFP